MNNLSRPRFMSPTDSSARRKKLKLEVSLSRDRSESLLT